jgi:hypothetical protein
LFTAQHVSGVFPPIIRSSMTAVAASGFTFVSWWQSCYVRDRAGRPDHEHKSVILTVPDSVMLVPYICNKCFNLSWTTGYSGNIDFLRENGGTIGLRFCKRPVPSKSFPIHDTPIILTRRFIVLVTESVVKRRTKKKYLRCSQVLSDRPICWARANDPARKSRSLTELGTLTLMSFKLLTLLRTSSYVKHFWRLDFFMSELEYTMISLTSTHITLFQQEL